MIYNTQGHTGAHRGTQGHTGAHSRLAVYVSAAVFAVAPFTSFAQLTPPTNNTYKWTGAAGNSTWSDAGNWDGGSIPTANNANVHFTDAPAASGPEAEVELPSGTPKTLRSLWFDAAVAYTLNGDDVLTLGFGLPTNQHMIAITKNGDTSNDVNWGAETNINPEITIAASGTPRTRWIENQSEGGLGLNGNLNLGASNLLLTGGQATRFGGDLSGSGSITLTGPSGLLMATPTHLVLQGNNAATWSGALDIYSHAMGIVKSETALGSGTTTVHSGGTLAWRSHFFLETEATAQSILVEGEGIVRQDNTLPVGAVYNDGGFNQVADSFTLTGDTWFGSRGDIGGGLTLIGQISDGGAGHSFIKVGPGLIVLADSSLFTGTPPAPEDRNTWGKTILRDGVLRIASEWALPDANLLFEGGILELGWEGDFTRNLGSGTGEVQWSGDGGFSASDDVRTVSLNGGAALTWGQQYFVQDDYALLLGSRYSNAQIEFQNAINLAGDIREIRVARGLSQDSYAVLSGILIGGGLRKTGDGLLHLTGANTYTGNTVIEAGALRGAIHANSHIRLDGGVLALDGNFTRGRWASNGSIRWMGSGGFAAYGEDRIVRIDNEATSAIGWGWDSFVPNDKELIFGYRGADATVLWDRPLAFSGTRTIRLNRGASESGRADVLFQKDIRGNPNSKLYLVGDGRMDINVSNPSLQSSHIYIYGAELRLHSAGTLNSHATTFELRYGGILTLDNIGMHSTPDAGGSNHSDRIHDQSSVILATAFLNYNPTDENTVEKLGLFHLESGANRFLLLGDGELHIKALVRGEASHATLEFVGDSSQKIRLDQLEGFEAINDDSGTAITPWGTNGTTWLSPTTLSGNEYLARLAVYHTEGEDTWSASHNVLLNTAQPLSDNRTVNSLIFENAALLNLNSNTLTLNSGGLMSSLAGGVILGNLGSTITTASNDRPLYIHGALTLGGSVTITGSMDVVKARIYPLTLSSNATHLIGSLYIHQGRVTLRNGYLSTSGKIVIGDGAGEREEPIPSLVGVRGDKNDILELPANRWNPLITPDPNVFPKITLHGTPYDPRSPEYGGGQAILRMGGNTKQHLSELYIQDRGTIDWVGGEMGKANILYLDKLTFSGPDAILFMRNWYEYEDFLLVRDGGFDYENYLQNVHFEGYENFPVQWRRYDNDYYQITPFIASKAPEPATTGAILGTVGIGLVAWRRRNRRAANEQPAK